MFGWLTPGICGPGSSSGKALDYGLDGYGVGGVEIFLQSFVSRLVLGCTQPPIKLVPGLSPEVKATECRTSHPTSPYAMAVRMWALASTSPWAFMVCNGDTFTSGFSPSYELHKSVGKVCYRVSGSN